LRGDFNSAFKKAAGENQGIVFAHIDPSKNAGAAERLNAGSKPVLIVWDNGEEITRRVRPWGSDVPLAIELLNKRKPAENGSKENTDEKEPEVNNASNTVVDDKPVIVTDETFQSEVIDYEKPVLVDFWAPWCGLCRMVAPILEKLAKEFTGQVRIAKVNVDGTWPSERLPHHEHPEHDGDQEPYNCLQPAGRCPRRPSGS
jgi:thiol-disulfide isomerase/thioredoxin